VTDELCRFLPQLHADQLLMIWPTACSPEPSDLPTLWMLKAELGERDDDRFMAAVHPNGRFGAATLYGFN
jgi:hypothetical protein